MSSSQISNKRSQKKDNSKISDRTLNSNTGLKMQSLVDTTRNTFLEWGKYAVEQFWHYEDKPPETFCDWLTFVSPSTGISEDTLSEIINEVMIGTFWGKEYQVEQYDTKMAFFRGGAYFNYRYVSEIGSKLSTRTLDSGMTIAILSLSGGVLSQIFKRNDLLSVALFVNYMVNKGFHISRCDFSIDDFQKKLDVFQVSDWVRRGNYQFFQNKRIIESGGLIKDKNVTTGLTIECGSRESDFFGRIYDTFKKHKKNATRYEGEFKDKKAKQIQDLLIIASDNYLHPCNEAKDYLYICNEKLLRNIQNILLSSISFCDRNKGKRIDTKMVYPEFIEWIEYKKYVNKNFEKRRFVTRPKEPSIKRSWQYLDKSVKGTLSLFFE
jgi:Replication initiation factor